MDDLIIALPTVFSVVFVAAVGACIGSLLNVLVYRLPRGMGVVTPASRCPSCGTRLTFRENIPVVGWLVLGGRCRFCKSRISAEYPLVEAFTAALFAGVFWLWYAGADGPGGLRWISPEWAQNGLAASWPTLAAVFTLFACLIAMTLIDARTYTIPLVLTWVPAGAALVLHTGHAAVWSLTNGGAGAWRAAEGWRWALPTPGSGGWMWIGASLGAVVGLGVSAWLVRRGLIRQSFADYAAWEAGAIAEQAAAAGPERGGSDGSEAQGSEGGAGDGGGGAPGDHGAGAAAMWIQYPHARREMVKEAAFCGPVVMLGVAGGWLGPWLMGASEAPLWVCVLSGVLWGYVVGGGVVWLVRMLGTLAFGKEAMGIGDVHLMAAVGATVGWVDAVLGFFGAAFVGIAYAVLAAAASGGRMKRAMPYGPFLAVASVLVVVGKPWVEMGLAALLSAEGGVDLP